jgi:hypothetical protein
VLVERDHGRLEQDDAFPAADDDGVRGSEIDCEVGRVCERRQSHARDPYRRIN